MRGDKVAPGTDQLGGGAFTPGPWMAAYSHVDYKGNQDVSIVASDRRSVVRIDSYSTYSSGERETISWVRIKPADARLISAAPDLYEIVRRGLACGAFAGHLKEEAERVMGAAADASANQESPAAPLTLNADEHSEERCTCCEGDCGGGK